MSRFRKPLIVTGILLAILAGLFWWLSRPTQALHTDVELSGKDPVLAEPQTEVFPSIVIATPVGWKAGEAPKAAEGLTVARFAEGLEHPRTMLTLPNGDVIVAETRAPAGNLGGLKGWVAGLLMGSAGAGGESPDRLTLLRDADGDGKAEGRFVLREKNGLSSPSGLAWGADKLYVANHDAVLVFDFVPGATALAGEPKKLFDLPPSGNHWMRNLLLSPDGKNLYAAVGSASNIGENGLGLEEGRASIWEIDVATGRGRKFATGLRNPNGMAWNPSIGELWTVVNERDQLGPDLVPDYLTNVPIGAQYGWPWYYWKDLPDRRVSVPAPLYIEEYIRRPEYAVGAHTAPLGLLFDTGGHRLGSNFANGAFIARHGSWNRSPAAGYDVIFVKFDANGNPLGKPVPVLTGFLTGDGDTRGRPTWLAFDKQGALLVSDDTAGIVWRTIAPSAAPSVAPKPVVTARLQPVRELKGDPSAGTSATFKPDEQ